MIIKELIEKVGYSITQDNGDIGISFDKTLKATTEGEREWINISVAFQKSGHAGIDFVYHKKLKESMDLLKITLCINADLNYLGDSIMRAEERSVAIGEAFF